MDPQVVRYSERPELWDEIGGLADEVWPEYNQHGETIDYYWAQLYDVFPEWQFVLYDSGDRAVLAEGNTVPLDWDGTDPGLGPGIDATLAIPPRRQGRRLSSVLLTALAALAAEAGLSCLIAPVRPSRKGHSPRPATTSSPPAWPPCTSTGTSTSGSTGNPTSGSSTRPAGRMPVNVQGPR